ncbi:Cullin binding-domain-containing protein [Jimgerdemannia flammicorona]|uniref:Defective in cullin neddylation protein n=1 Tax=Jimgerdemannia flammicorona TaxID=994334 RepID=A0A433QJL5_9FUNG|nr:Cullin binding-domain-containing protein [Jimgerdemannia flammicorona]
MPPKRKRAANTTTATTTAADASINSHTTNTTNTTDFDDEDTMGAKQSSPSTSSSSKRKRPNAQGTTTANNGFNPPSSLSLASSNGSSSKKGSTKPRSLKFTLTHWQDNRFSMTRCNAWFDEYRDADDVNMIGPEGIERFCAVVDVSLDDVYPRASACVETGGCDDGVDSTSKLRTKLPELNRSWRDPESFKELYRYSFGFAKNKDQKCMDLETAKAMWQLLLGNRFAHTDAFLKFLDVEDDLIMHSNLHAEIFLRQDKKPVKVINKDQWLSFHEFSTTVAEDLSNHDDMSACELFLVLFI